MAPSPGGGESEDMLYSSGTSLYRYLDANPSELENSENLENFYDSLAVGSVGKFSQVENYLYEGNQIQAVSVNALVLPSNNVEANYQQYYALYNSHMNGTFSTLDSTDLYNLASLCPGSDGPCVYQARALYNYIYSTVLHITENCVTLEEQGTRRFTTNVPNNIRTWTVDLFPNPSDGKIQISSKTKTGMLQINVKDLSGRTLLNKQVPVQDYKSFLDLDLKDGVYLVTLKNATNETLTKKLVIAH
jgi:hypothetical protein